MRFCYLDESGTEQLTGDTSHFVLVGLSIQGESWKAKDAEISTIKQRYGIRGAEVHAGWVARRYLEQERIPDFESLSIADRRLAVQNSRDAFLIKKAALHGTKAVQTDRKNFAKTKPYIHLTLTERRQLLQDICGAVLAWDDCRLFAECTDKRTFGGVAPRTSPFEEAFSQVVSRLHRFLDDQRPREHGLLVQDNNETMAARLTHLMQEFHDRGTRWTQLPLIVETPLFVDSSLTSMVQVADVCAYATRRFCELGETQLFNLIFPKFNRAGNRLVGVRHYTNREGPSGRWCACRICSEH